MFLARIRPKMLQGIWFIIAVIRFVGTSTIGYSGVISENDLNSYKALPSNSSNYHNIKSWSVPEGSGFYNYSISVNDQGLFVIPIEGIYLISANIILKSTEATFVEVSVRHSLLRDVCYCRAVAHVSSRSGNTVMLSCFARFIVETNIVLNLKNLKNIDVEVGSTISLHYLGMIGNIASFVLPMKDASVVNNKAIVPVHMDVRGSKYYNALTDISNLAHIKIPCSGIYLVTLNAIVAVTSKYVFKLNVNDVILLSITDLGDQKSTINFLQSLHLKKDDLITITISDVTFLPDSIYGVVRLGDVNNAEGVYSLLTGTNNHAGQNNGKYSPLSLNFNPANMNRPYYENSAFISNPVTKEFSRIQFKKQGIYLFSIHLVIAAPSKDIDLVVYSKGYYDGSRIRPRDGLRTMSKRVNGQSTCLILSGILRLYDYDEVSILIENAKSFHQISQMSITKLIPYTFASTAIIPMTSQSVIKCENKWKPLSGFEVEKDQDGNDKNYLDLNKHFKVDKYVVPSSGIYLVMAETAVQYAGEPVLQSIILALGRGNANGDFDPIINSYTVTKQKQRRLTIRHIVKLKKDDSLMFQMTCNKSIEFVHKTKLEVIFLSNSEDVSYLEASKYSSYPSLQTQRTLKAPAHGTYFVTMNKLIHFELLEEKSKEVAIYVYPQKGKSDPNNAKLDGLVSKEYLDYQDMGLKGLITLQVSGFIQMKKDDNIIVEVDAGTANDGELLITSISETFVSISLSNPGLSQYSFKSVQKSKLQFMVNKEFTIQNFDSISLIYQSPNARFFGPQFIVDKPMLILYDFSMELEGVKGEFRIQLKIRPKPGVTLLSEKISVIEKDNIMLKAVGVLKLEQSESVEVIIYSKSRELLKSSHRSWSIIELLPPNSQRHRRDIVKTTNSYPTQDLSTSGYIQLTYKHSNQSSLPIDQQLLSHQNPLNVDASTFPIVLDTFRLSVGNKPQIFSRPYKREMKFSVRWNNYDDKYCVVAFVQLRISGEFLNEVSILLKSVNKKVFYSPLVNRSVIILLCLLSGETLVVKSDTMTWSPNGVEQYINVTFSPIDKLDNLNGFSGAIKPNTTMTVIPGETKRVVEWISQGLPYFSNKASGLLPVAGAFILRESGYYYISLNIIVQKHFKDGCELLVTGDTMVLFSHMITKQVTSLTDVLWLQRNLFIHMQLKCHSQKQVLSFQEHSIFSLYLIDSQPSFVTECVNSNVILQTNIKNESFNVPYGRNFELKCFDKSSAMGDFIWKRDNKIVYQINGGREATLKLENLTTDENGMYHCEMKRGYQMTKVNPIEITVVDPRPQLGLSSNSVYIGENYSANKLIAWVKVEAKNVKTNQLAKVKFTIVEGNEDGNFYTRPLTSKSHTSLLFRKPFDFEAKNEYNLTIKAENLEYEGTDGSTTASLVVRVVNRNEHRPTFPTDTKSKFTIKENMKTGFKLYTFKASDDDDIHNIRYSCEDPLNRNLFSMNESTGVLSVTGNVDFEAECEILLLICAWDNLYKTCIHIQISIQNENDNPPYFMQSFYTVNITGATAQPGASIVTLRAVDKDTTKNENDGLEYAIVSGDEDGYFTTDGNKIKLLRRYSDYSKWFQLYVNVSDGYYKADANALVKIHVLGEDPIPIFSKKVYYTNVKENSTIDTSVIQLPLSYDGKSVTYKGDIKISFSISNLKNINEKYFRIDDKANILVITDIDYERVKTIFLLVNACVRTAGLDKCGITHVTINVTDINDNKPGFEKSNYDAFLPESHQNETFIIQVKANDKDSIGENSRISYHLEDNYNIFRINNITGEVYTTRIIDENDGRYFVLSVKAKDAGTPQMVSDPIVVNIEMLATSESSNLAGLRLKNWEFWILPCLVSIVLLLMLAVATISWKYRRSRRRFQEYVLEQPVMMDNKRNSFLTYISKPIASQEETMYLSCGTLPSAYNSERELSKSEGLNNKTSSNVMFTENGYTSFANEAHHSEHRNGTAL